MASPREALQQFLSVAKAQDFAAMGLVWGSTDGPARSKFGRTELEQREFVMMKCLRHDRYQVLSESPAVAGKRLFTVELGLRDLTASSTFTAIQGPRGRWYIEIFGIEDLQKICTSM